MSYLSSKRLNAPAIIESEKSHDLVSVNWRPSKAFGVIPVKRLKNEGS